MGAVIRRYGVFAILILVLCALVAGVIWLSRDKAERSPQRESLHEVAQGARAPQMEAPLAGVDRTGVGDVAITPVEPPPAAASESTENKWRQSRLDELDRMYEDLVQLSPDSTIGDPFELNMFFWLTIAPQMDARGEYEELIPLAKTRVERRVNENVFTFRNRVYRVPMGLYPEFDEFCAFMEKAGGSPKAVPSPDSKLPAFYVDQSYLDHLAVMMHDAQTAIRARTDPY